MIVRRGLAVVALIGLPALAACVAFASMLPGDELVLRPGDTLVARTPKGMFRVDALSETKRRYAWPNVDRTVTLGGRARPWYGAQGAYVAADFFNDTNADENSYDFASERTLDYYLQAFPPTAYASDGTTVSFGTAPNGSNSVTVEKLCVDHRPPIALRASAGSSFSWTHAASPVGGIASYDCARTILDPVELDAAVLREDLDNFRQSLFMNSQPGEGCELVTGSASSEPPALAIAQTVAFRSGASFLLHNVNGSLQIEATSATRRVVHWHNSHTGVVPFDLDTEPREMTFELGGGVMEAGDAGSDACRRVSGTSPYTVTYDEGALDFATVDDFRAWMKWGNHTRLYLDDRYGSAGVLAGFRVGHAYNGGPLLAVDVFRICIGGSPASKLPGANDADVRLEGAEPPIAWSCPGGSLDVANNFRYWHRLHELDTPRERRLRRYLGI
jgi:hypothetical protein